MATEITTWAELAAINSGLSGDYVLMNDLSSSDTGYDTYASSSANSGAGWDPLGDSTTKFTGTFDGQNYTISDLYISRSAEDYIGLFGYIGNGYGTGHVENFLLLDSTIIGKTYVGTLSGYLNRDSTNNIAIINSNVTGTSNVGGLYGYCYSQYNRIISNCYVLNTSCTTTSNYVYVGVFGGTGTSTYLTNCYASGTTSGSIYGDGFHGFINGGTITNCFYDSTVSGDTSSSYATPKTTTEMQTLSTFSAWNIVGVTSKADGYANHTYTWNQVDGSTYPFLSWEYTEGGSGWTGTINGVSSPSKINGISVANISKVNGI